jgi:hypothetical protein
MYGLYNDAVSISDYIESKGRMTASNELEITRKEEIWDNFPEITWRD